MLFAVTLCTWLSVTVLGDDFARFDASLPSAIDASSIAPVFDFDTDSCLPAGGISTNGDQNGGLNPSGSLTGSCRSSNFLDLSNSYHRYACSSVATDGKKYCVHIYALYFEKDQLFANIESGHRHDWEAALVWTVDGVVTHASTSAHGDFDTQAAADVPFQDGHVKMVYHKESVGSHALRFAKQDGTEEDGENPYGVFVTPAVITWFEFASTTQPNFVLRTLLIKFNYGSANLPTEDYRFFNDINEFKPSSFPAFAWGDIFSANPTPAYTSFAYDGYKTVVNANSGLCLDVNQGVVANGQNVIVWTCSAADNQKWFHDPANNLFRSYLDPRWCLDAQTPIVDHSNVQLWYCHGDYNQRWVQDGVYFKVDGYTQVLDAVGSSAGSNVIAYANHGGANQQWNVGTASFLIETITSNGTDNEDATTNVATGISSAVTGYIVAGVVVVALIAGIMLFVDLKSVKLKERPLSFRSSMMPERRPQLAALVANENKQVDDAHAVNVEVRVPELENATNAGDKVTDADMVERSL